MLLTPKSHFDQDIGRARALRVHAAGLPTGLLAQDIQSQESGHVRCGNQGVLKMRGMLLCAALACLTCHSSWSAEDKKPDSASNAYVAKPDLRGTKQSPFIVETLPSEHTHTKTYEEKEQEKDKAFAERVIAYSTLALAIVTTLLALFTLGLMIFTGKLWRATGKLVKDAEEISERQAQDTRESLGIARVSADAARDTVKTMQDTAERQLRAYVFVNSIDSRQVIGAPGLVDNVVIAPRLENSGATPPKHMETRTNWQWFEDGVVPNNFDFPEHREKAEIALLGPRAVIEGDPAVVPRPIIDRVAKSGRLLVWGWVDYDDVFDGTARHRTEFCYEITVIERRDEWQKVFLDSRFYGKHNAADDECYRRPQPFASRS
jgi:hypothetical protein